MDIYGRKSRWKIYLAVFGLVIVAASLYFSSRLANELRVSERQQAQNLAGAFHELSDLDDESALYIDVTFFNSILESNKTIPVIIVEDMDKILWTKNFGDAIDTETFNHSMGQGELSEATRTFLQQEIQDLRDSGFEPITAYNTYVYYKESKVLTQLHYFPFIQLLLIGTFIFFGSLGINAARRSEQNRVWVGMAKETAHQLGTPISAIIAWIEHLKLIREKDTEVQQVVEELRKDVYRLELVADRFSKIGSDPKLQPTNVYTELDKCRSYMAVRAPRRVSFHFPAADSDRLFIDINPPLFDWVIENLLRNSLDAMEGKGEIHAEIYDDGDYVKIDLTDTGKGIPSNKHKTVFQPGYTTKKRGWGLGLSLAKRIIEEYHSGRIFVKRSVPGEGTTFTIRMPKSKQAPPVQPAKNDPQAVTAG